MVLNGSVELEFALINSNAVICKYETIKCNFLCYLSVNNVGCTVGSLTEHDMLMGNKAPTFQTAMN